MLRRIATNKENGAKIYWDIEDSGEGEKKAALVIKKDGITYAFPLTKPARAIYLRIGFKTGSPYNHNINITCPADRDHGIDFSTYPKATANTKGNPNRNVIDVMHWVDQQILNLCGAEFVKNLKGDKRFEILNDPTTAFKLQPKKAKITVKRSRSHSMNLTIQFNATSATWRIKPIHLSKLRNQPYGSFPIFKSAKEAYRFANNVLRPLLENEDNDAAFAEWYTGQDQLKKDNLIRNASGNVAFSESIYDKDAHAKLMAMDGVSEATLRDMNDEDLAFKLYQLRGEKFIGVEQYTDTATGKIRYRGHINLGQGQHWYTHGFIAATDAAVEHDRALRQLSPLKTPRFRHNYYNFFNPEMLSIEPLTGSEREERIKEGVTKYYPFGKPRAGFVVFDKADRLFKCYIRDKADMDDKKDKDDKTGHYKCLRSLETQHEAVLFYDMFMTQMYKDKASTMRINIDYDADTIKKWEGEEARFSSKPRVPTSKIVVGINEVFKSTSSGTIFAGYRGIFELGGRAYRTKLFECDSDDDDKSAAREKAAEAYDRLVASAHKRYGPSDLPPLLAEHDEAWYKSIKPIGVQNYKSTWYGVGIYNNYNHLNPTWCYSIYYHYKGEAHIERNRDYITEKDAADARDTNVRQLYQAGRITLSFYLSRINTPNNFETALARALNRKKIGHHNEGAGLNLTANPDASTVCRYQPDGVIGTVTYQDESGRPQHVGIYAKEATKAYAEPKDALAAATKLFEQDKIKLSAKQLSSTDILLKLLHEDPDFALPSSHAADRDSISTQLENGFGMRAVDNPGSGDCLFYAFADQLRRIGVTQADGTPHTHVTLRALAATEIRDHFDHYLPFIAGDAVDFLLNVAVQGIWGNQLHIQALSRCLGLDVVIVHRDNGAGQPNGVYTNVLRQTADDGGVNPTRAVMLGYIDDTHYVSPEPLAAGHEKHLAADVQQQRIRDRIATTEHDPGYDFDVAPLNPDAQQMIDPDLSDDDDEDIVIVVPQKKRKPVVTERRPGHLFFDSASEDGTPPPSSDSGDSDSEIDGMPASKTRRRQRSPSPTAGIFARPSASSYMPVFYNKIDINNHAQALGRLSGLMNFLCHTKRAHILNDIATSISVHQARLQLSNRATAVIVRALSMLAAAQPDYASVKRHIDDKYAYAMKFITDSGLTEKISTAAITNNDDLLAQIQTAITNTADYGDNTHVNMALLVNVFYAALMQHSPATEHHKITAEFIASYGADKITKGATPEHPYERIIGPVL